jgi:hypothetical protein
MMAANGGFLIGWNRVVPGMEQLALALFGEALAFWGRQQQAGAIESFEPVFLAPHGGDLNGFFLIRGDAVKLHQVMATDEYVGIETRASYMLDGHGVIEAFFGEGITRRMGIYQKVIAGD